MATTLTSRSARYAIGAVLLAFAASACVPQPAPNPDTEPCVPVAGTVTNGDATLTVSQVNCLEVGDVVTVTGSGYTTTGNLGTRPPLANSPAGVYVVFGEFGDSWRPSEGAAGANRKVLSQRWALPEPSFSTMGGQPPFVLIEADGTFTAELEIAALTGTNPNLGFATYAGSGAPANAGEEIFISAEIEESVAAE